jgi:hypothetical protein
MLHDLAHLRRFLGAGLGLACRWRKTKLVWPSKALAKSSASATATQIVTSRDTYIGEPAGAPWSRSLFNGLAQIIVQSTKDAGEIKLAATAAGLAPVTTSVNTQPVTPRPSIP